MKIALALACLALTAPFLAAEGLYRFGLHLVGAPQAVRVVSPDLTIAAAWLVAGERPLLQVEPCSPAGFVVDVLLDRAPFERAGYRAASRAARPWVERHPGLRSWRRALALWAATVWATRHWSAAELTQAWLDSAWFGRGARGLEAGSRVYLGKPASELEVDELALLLAISRAPSRFDPRAHPDRVRAARDAVLRRLLAAGVIGEAEHARAAGAELPRAP